MRPATERYSSSGRHSRLMDQHQCLGIAKMGFHGRMSRLTYVATFLARLKAGDVKKMRHMTIRIPKSTTQPKNNKPNPGVAALLLHELNSIQKTAA